MAFPIIQAFTKNLIIALFKIDVIKKWTIKIWHIEYSEPVMLNQVRNN